MIPGVDVSVKNEVNLRDECRGSSKELKKEGMLDLVDVIGLYIRKYSVALRGDKPLRIL